MMPARNGQLIRYAAAAGSAAVVDVGGFTQLTALHTPTVLAAACSFLTATVVNFLLSSRWVFQQQASLRGYALFLSGSLFSLLVNVSVTSILVIHFVLPRGLSKLLAVAATFLLSYSINARLVFRSRTGVRTPTPID